MQIDEMTTETVFLLTKKIVDFNPMQEKFIKQAIKQLSNEEVIHLDHYIRFLFSTGYDMDYIANSYNMIVKDILKEQIHFLRHKRYRYSRYEEVSSSVYQNPAYMEQYMIGLALTSFFWPQHIAIHRWFLEKIPKTKKGRYLEVGPGHGYHFITSLKYTKFDFYEGIDISPTSVSLTRSFVESSFPDKKKDYLIHEGDILTCRTDDKYEAIVMCEVLEHVEQPGELLRKIAALSKPDTFIFVTTVINAPAIDHIYLFRNVDEVKSIIEGNGLSIREYIIVPVYKEYSIEESLEKLLPLNIALILEK